MNTLAKTSLYFSEGSSNKEYHAEIVEVVGGIVVNFRYGRRGGTLTTGSKTPVPVDLVQAQNIYDKLVKDKTAKGYTPDISGAAYQGTAQAGLKSDFTPQLLNPITEADAMRLIQDDRWAAQEKMDGERRAAHAQDGEVIGINRKGLIVPLPKNLADELLHVAACTGAIRVDGEIIGDILYVFDLHVYESESITAYPWLQRMRFAEALLKGCKQLKSVPVAVSTEHKLERWNQVQFERGEGVVFKRVSCAVTAGRPNSGGDWLKFKFTESASCCVIEVNAGRRSFKIGLLDSSVHSDVCKDQRLIPVGNVTIPPNHAIPLSGEIVEVEYLYAYRGGSLYQPVYRGRRVDVDLNACTLSQLKFKPEGGEDDDAQ